MLNEDPEDAKKRVRELYKYFIPPGSPSSTSKSSAPDTVLGAHAQLVAWRMNTRRAMVSLIDRDTQYFVAESSKTLDLADSNKFDDPLDALWAGCINVPKAGRLCEHTIQAAPSPESGVAYFEVLDLTKDARFDSLPFVTGDPHFRYYCGVPLITKNGVPIGSIFAIDDAVREPVTSTMIDFMVTMASNCMAHMEALKERESMKRYKLMNMCLTAFVDPENGTRRRKKRKPRSFTTTASPRQHRNPIIGSAKDPVKTSQAHVRIQSPEVSGFAADNRITTSHDSSEPTTEAKPVKVEDDDYLKTFKSAARLLAQSLEIQSPGGVVFLDSGTALNSVSHLDSSSDDEQPQESKNMASRASTATGTQVSYRSWGGSLNQPDATESSPPSNPAEVLAYSTEHTSSETPPSSDDFEFSPLSQAHLAKLIKKYPRGIVFNLDTQDVAASSSSGEDAGRAYIMPRKQSVIASKAESVQLLNHFPRARQIIFVPVWNPSFSRFSAFFAVNRNRYRIFEQSPDFLHSIAFGHCLTTELTRIVTMAADQQKSDFIGSISHELRSPLHGILASCEFLGDTELTSFQKSLVDTSDSCARTLLDTINMVLDYSKINAFERNITKARRDRKRHQQQMIAPQLQPALNIYGEVDLAAITEEVVEGVATGQVFKDRLAYIDVADIQHSPHPSSAKGKPSLPNVEVIIDIPPRNWLFLTQPGAFRRVVMNVFGNSLKYTSRGHISIKLSAEPGPKRPGGSEDAQIITLTITDTGQGISAKYMKTRLFTPFAQENTISPGTGLGLSLVHSIVRMLNGEIDIKSTLGVGTEVTIKFPMDTSPPSSDKSESTPSTGGTSSAGIERAKDDSLYLVRSRTKGKSALYFSPTRSNIDDKASAMLKDVVSGYFTDWYHFNLVPSLNIKQLPDIIIVRHTDFSTLLSTIPGLLSKKNGPGIIVIYSDAGSNFNSADPQMSRVETISYPFGPYKLAKILRLCLDNFERNGTSPPFAKNPSPSQISDRDGVMEVVQHVDEVTIGTDVRVVQQGQIMANQDFATLMVDALSAQSTRSIEQGAGFPFPSTTDSQATPTGHLPLQIKLEKLTIRSRPTTPRATTPLHTTTSFPSEAVKSAQEPRLLLVDDNKINLRLLNTFMQKRGYLDVRMAEDGAAAVEAYKSMIYEDPPRPPDIIFMDISMPIMNGFEATRQIRDVESQFRDGLSPMETPATSMIIALTGLASSRDQSEAFTSGFDLYLVKPISFKSVAKLLDSWERNGGAATVPVPHGPVSGGDIQPA